VKKPILSFPEGREKKKLEMKINKYYKAEQKFYVEMLNY
jgi:hypothetical protein